MTASTAGAEHGFTLLWAVLFSVVATIILQDTAARLGIVSGAGLAESISTGFSNRAIRLALVGLVLAAILFGNSAYQTGNLLGASSGLEIMTRQISGPTWSAVIAAIALAVVLIGRADVLQGVLTLLVAIMGILFVLAAVVSRPGIGNVLHGFVPRVPRGSEWFVIGLIGTTVVPYNLFLHASAAANQWGGQENKQANMRYSLLDTFVSVSAGGVITAAILITAAVTFAGTNQKLEAVEDVAAQLEPTLGKWAEVAFAFGIFSAGLTSAITAPVAAGFATAGCFGWSTRLSNPRLKAVAAIVIVSGLVCAIAFGAQPETDHYHRSGCQWAVIAVHRYFSLVYR